MFGFKKTGGSVEYLVVGLGNPDKKYENTRHNCGWLAIDHIAEKRNCRVNKIKFKSFVGECAVGGKRAMLMKPTTYMNNSGQAVKMRIRSKGSDGGQKGMRSIIYLSGKDTFPRIKIGIGAKPNPEWELADWVLSKFTKDEQKALTEMFDNANDAIDLMAEGRIDRAMNMFN